MQRFEAVVVAGALALGAPIQAQVKAHEHYPDAAAPPAVMQALLEDVEAVEGKLIALAEAMPADAHAWRPGEGVRSMSEVIMHVAADNYFIPALAGAAAPAETGIEPTSYQSVQAFEARQVDRPTSMAELRTSFEHLKRVMAGVDENDLARELDVFGQTMTGLQLWIMTATHLHEHLGQGIAYARVNGVVPPWSAQQ